MTIPYVQKTYSTLHGGVHTDAIWVVRKIFFDALDGSGSYTVEGYHDQSYVDARNPFMSYTSTFSENPDPSNTRAQNIALIYQHELAGFLSGGTLVTP